MAKTKYDDDDTTNLVCVGGVWYLRAMINGVKIKQSLRTKSLQEARILRDERLSMLAGRRDEKSLLQSVKRQLTGINQEEEAEERDKRRGKLISDAMKLWEKDPARGEISPGHKNNLIRFWRDFTAWLGREHPEIRYCRQLTPAIGKEYAVDIWGRVGSKGTYNKCISGCRVILSTVCDMDDYMVDPFSKVHIAKVEMHSRDAFTSEELAKIFATDNKEMRLLFAIGLYTTQRLDVSRHMTWEMFTPDLALLEVTHHKTGADGSMIVPPELKEILSEVPPENRHGYICPTFAAQPSSTTSQVIKDFLDSLEIVTSKEFTGMNGEKRMYSCKGFHSLRHTAITMALQHGASIAQVKRLAGHATIAMQEHYSHLGAEDAGKASESIGKFW